MSNDDDFFDFKFELFFYFFHRLILTLSVLCARNEDETQEKREWEQTNDNDIFSAVEVE